MTNERRSKLKQRMIILLGTIAALQTVFLGSVGWAVISTSEQLDKVRRVKSVVGILSRLSNLTQDMTLSVLNIVSSRERAAQNSQGWVADYNRIEHSFSKEMNQLKRSLKAYPEAANELKELIDGYQVGVELMEKLKTELNFDTGKHYFTLFKLQDASNQTTEHLERLESKFRRLEESTNDELHAQSDWSFYTALFLGVIVNTLAAYLLYRFFVKKELGRLQVVADNTINLAVGKPLAEPVKGDDEIAELDRSIRELGDVLSDYQSKERTILENAAEFICSINSKGVFVEVTQASSSLWGLDREEIVGRRISSLINPNETETTLAAIEKLFNERVPVTFETTVHHKQGGYLELAWSAQPGEEDTVVMIAHDITERNRVTRLIRESEEQFRTIIDSLPATVLTLNHAFQVTSANPATTRMFQFQPAELLGKDFGIIFTGTTVQQTEDASIVRAAQTQPIELQARRKDSTPIAVSLNVNRFINNDRENFLAVLQDITTRREIELVKRDFISMISHDLRSPLTSLHGTLGMMSAQIQDQPLAEETNKEREILMESEIRIGQLVNLINDFLDLEKIESGTFAFETTDVSVLKLIGAASEQMKTSMPDSDRTLSYANVDPTAKVRVDLDRMVMALLSFVSAIVRFSPNTSTAIITAEKRYGRTSMFVTAEGCTIPQETRETCLKRYAIVDFGQHETWTVSGLSLALARATIEAHQGALDIETRDGRDGFVFTLPG